jgi:hypothetical protein
MLRIDDKREEVRTIEKGACRGLVCIWIGYYKYLLSFSLIHVIGQVCE